MSPLYLIVFYQTKISDSPTFQSLLEHFAAVSSGPKKTTVLLFDNSPQPQQAPLSQNPHLTINYFHSPENVGTAGAYNYGLSLVEQLDNQDWLVLLDQDTTLPEDYFKQMTAAAQQASKQTAALVPFVYQKKQQLSPTQSEHLQMHRFPLKEVGLYQQNLTAIASGTWVRSDFLKKIHGFSAEFPLDYLDHWLFYQILEKEHQAVQVVDTVLQHQLSIRSMDSLSLKRYKQILDAEYRYYAFFQTALFGSYRRHLFFRTLKQVIRLKNKQFAVATFHYLAKKKATQS